MSPTDAVHAPHERVHPCETSAAFAEYDRVMRPFIAVNQALGIQSAQFMTQDPASALVELSGREIESVIDRSTDRIADAVSAITPKDYSRFTAEPTA